MLTREMLKEYYCLDKQIDRVRQKMEYYRNKPIPTNNLIVSGSENDYPFNNGKITITVLDTKAKEENKRKIDSLLVELKQNEMQLDCLKTEIDCFVAQLDSPEIKEIIDLKVHERLTDQEIADILGYSREAVNHKIKKCLDDYNCTKNTTTNVVL